LEVFYAAGRKAAKTDKFIEAAKKVSAHIPIGVTAVFECPICGYGSAYCSVERSTYEVYARCGKCGTKKTYRNEKGSIYYG